jgi:hypothetical protein
VPGRKPFSPNKNGVLHGFYRNEDFLKPAH